MCIALSTHETKAQMHLYLEFSEVVGHHWWVLISLLCSEFLNSSAKAESCLSYHTETTLTRIFTDSSAARSDLNCIIHSSMTVRVTNMFYGIKSSLTRSHTFLPSTPKKLPPPLPLFEEAPILISLHLIKKISSNVISMFTWDWLLNSRFVFSHVK